MCSTISPLRNVASHAARGGRPVSASGGERLFRQRHHWHGLIQVAVCILCLVTLAITAPTAVMAEEEGCGCHSEESNSWLDSTHNRALAAGGEVRGPTCEDCHGVYVRGHPDEGTMALTADSGVCADCHSDTYGQWQGSKHAQENVQCIGCHLTHSQTLRLADDKLCASCHRESPSDVFHLSHRTCDISCTTCHVSPTTGTTIDTRQDVGLTAVQAQHTHDFTAVDANGCVDCHADLMPGDGGTDSNIAFDCADGAVNELMMVANRVPDLSAKLSVAKDENHALASLAYSALGLGIGIGAVMGMILVLVAGYVSQRDDQ